MMMTTLLVILGVVAAAVLIFYIRLKMAMKKSVNEVQSPPTTIPDGSVQCISCGMVVEKDKALEKKGRYFCGVKRNDRNGNPVVQDKTDEKHRDDA